MIAVSHLNVIVNNGIHFHPLGLNDSGSTLLYSHHPEIHTKEQFDLVETIHSNQLLSYLRVDVTVDEGTAEVVEAATGMLQLFLVELPYAVPYVVRHVLEEDVEGETLYIILYLVDGN